MQRSILRLNKAGQPVSWMNYEEAACAYSKGQVLWSLGDEAFNLTGGISQATGQISRLPIASIIATKGRISKSHSMTPALSNHLLFRRDSFLCMYCGKEFSPNQLTRDHIVPRAQGGKDSWTNCISSCRSCNQAKGPRTPEQAGMKLLAVPFKPNRAEFLALANRNILADQMDFLKQQFSRHMQ